MKIEPFDLDQPLGDAPAEMNRQTLPAEFEIKDAPSGSALMTVEGYASTKEVDAYNEVVEPGAFREHIKKFLDFPIVLFNHVWRSKPVGIVREYKIDTTGLWVSVDILDTSDGRDVASLIKAGLLKAFSIGFETLLREQAAEAGEPDVIKKLRLYEISIVNVPANVQSLFSEAKSMSIELKSLNRSTGSGEPTRKDRPMGAGKVPDQDALFTIKEAEAMTQKMADSTTALESKIDDLEGNIDSQAKLLTTVSEKQRALAEGKLTESEFRVFAEKIGLDIQSLQSDIRSAKNLKRYDSERRPITDWRMLARSAGEKNIAFVFNDAGHPEPDVVQREYLLTQCPISYEGPRGEMLKTIRDLHDLVIISDAYLSTKARGRYDITNLKSYKLLMDMIDIFDPEFAKAMSATGTGTGDEWVPTEMSAELHIAYEVAAQLAGYFPEFQMSSNPQTWPLRTTRPQMYRVSEAASNNPSEMTKSTFTTAKITFTAEPFGICVPVAVEFVEDSIIQVAGAIRDAIGEGMGYGTDSWLLNADDTTPGTHMDTAADWATDTGYPEAYGLGLRKMAIRDSHAINTQSTSEGDKATTFGPGDIRMLRASLGNRYGHRASDLVYATTLSVWIKALSFEPSTKIGEYNANASWLTGDLPRFDGSPFLITTEMKDVYNTTGVDDGSNNDHSAVVCVNTRQFKLASKRGITLEFEKNIRTQQLAFVATTRKDFQSMDEVGSAACALAINIEQ